MKNKLIHLLAAGIVFSGVLMTTSNILAAGQPGGPNGAGGGQPGGSGPVAGGSTSTIFCQPGCVVPGTPSGNNSIGGTPPVGGAGTPPAGGSGTPPAAPGAGAPPVGTGSSGA